MTVITPNIEYSEISLQQIGDFPPFIFLFKLVFVCFLVVTLLEPGLKVLTHLPVHLITAKLFFNENREKYLILNYALIDELNAEDPPLTKLQRV